jgi:cytoskeletal protein RodZ
VGKIAGFVLLSCGVLAAFAVLHGCGQANSPVESQEKEHGVELTKPKEADKSAALQPTPEPTTPASTSSKPTEEQVAQSEATCRLANYVTNENMTQQEASALSERVADRMGKEMQDDPYLSAGAAKNAALDDLGVPRYPECKVGGE